MYAARWLSEAAAWCRAHGVLLIVDEIALGFGRTGRMFAFEHADIDPDLVCVGKALTAGTLPLSATIAKDALYRRFTDDEHTLQHGHTFCGNPIASAAACRTRASCCVPWATCSTCCRRWS
jgi:adenosylmethionine-8-amino-7-oxononanoate aminotransferase